MTIAMWKWIIIRLINPQRIVLLLLYIDFSAALVCSDNDNRSSEVADIPHNDECGSSEGADVLYDYDNGDMGYEYTYITILV